MKAFLVRSSTVRLVVSLVALAFFGYLFFVESAGLLFFAYNAAQGPGMDKAVALFFLLWITAGVATSVMILGRYRNLHGSRRGLIGGVARAAMAGSAVMAPVILFGMVSGA